MMKYWLSYTFSVILAGVLFSLIYYLFGPLGKTPASYISPLPDVLTLGKNNQVTLLDFWSPIIETYASSDGKPIIGATSALIYNLDTDKTIYEKNSSERLPMASLTKIMTYLS